MWEGKAVDPSLEGSNFWVKAAKPAKAVKIHKAPSIINWFLRAAREASGLVSSYLRGDG